jgi:hypothetical protein
MIAGQSAWDRLVRFLHQEALDPTLRTTRDPHSVADGSKPKHVRGVSDGARQHDDGGRTRPAGAERVRGAFQRPCRNSGTGL